MVLDHAAPVAKPKVDASPVSPSDSGLLTILRSKGLAWERFKQAVANKDIAICYGMSVKEFERSIVHEKLQGIVDSSLIF